jgi:hypothetical protein
VDNIKMDLGEISLGGMDWNGWLRIGRSGELPTNTFLNFLLPIKQIGLTDIPQCKLLGDFMEGH